MTPLPRRSTPGRQVEGDEWADWLMRDRFGRSDRVELQVKTSLLHWRNRVLRNARIKPGDSVLDVGAGDGLIGLGALGLVGAAGRVVFSDVSARLLDRCRVAVESSGMPGATEYMQASAEDLGSVPDGSVDVVTTRSVLMHVVDRSRVFAEFRRVLRPGGRLSCFESISSRTADPDPGLLRGYDITPIRQLIDRVRACVPAGSLTATPTMLALDDAELVSLATAAGFGQVRMTLEVEVDHPNPARDWDFFYRVPVHPSLPTLEEAARACLSETEIDRLCRHLRPLVESGQGTRRHAVAYVGALR